MLSLVKVENKGQPERSENYPEIPGHTQGKLQFVLGACCIKSWLSVQIDPSSHMLSARSVRTSTPVSLLSCHVSSRKADLSTPLARQITRHQIPQAHVGHKFPPPVCRAQSLMHSLQTGQITEPLCLEQTRDAPTSMTQLLTSNLPRTTSGGPSLLRSEQVIRRTSYAGSTRSLAKNIGIMWHE